MYPIMHYKKKWATDGLKSNKKSHHPLQSHRRKIDEALINHLLIITFIINDNVEHQQINDQ